MYAVEATTQLNWSDRGYAERNLPSFFANSFGTLVLFKVDCKAEELTQGQHLVIMLMDTKVCFKSFLTKIIKLYNFSNI